MSRPICVGCNAEMRPIQNGMIVVYRVDGRYHETAQGDAYNCPTCDSTIITGFGRPYHNPDSKPDITLNVR